VATTIFRSALLTVVPALAATLGSAGSRVDGERWFPSSCWGCGTRLLCAQGC